MSVPMRFLLGSQLYASLGGEDSAGKTASGAVLMAAGANPLGVLLTRQVALSRLPDAPAVSSSPAPGTRAPVADFSHAANGLVVKFTDRSTGTIASRTWHFGGTTTSSEKDPQFTFDKPGLHKVALFVVGPDGVTNATARDIDLAATSPAPTPSPGPTPSPVPQGPTPVASFDVAVDGLNARFTDKSIGTIPTREWRFGDDATSSDVHPVHPYAAAGEYIVQLTVTDQQGVSNITKRRLVVGAATGTTPTPPAPAPAVPVADFAFAATGLGVQFTDKSSGAGIQSRRWEFGEKGASPSTDTNPTFSYKAAGNYKVALTVADDKGVSNTTTREITVK